MRPMQVENMQFPINLKSLHNYLIVLNSIEIIPNLTSLSFYEYRRTGLKKEPELNGGTAESSSVFFSTLANSESAFFIVRYTGDASFILESLEGELAKQFLVTTAEVEGKDLLEVVPGERRDAFLSYFREALEKGRLTKEVKGSKRLYCISSVVKHASDGPTIHGWAIDVSPLKELETRAARISDILKRLTDYLPIHTYIFDYESERLLYSNQNDAASNWLGATEGIPSPRAEFLKKLHPEDREIVDKHYNLLKEGYRGVLDRVIRVKDNDGDWQWYLIKNIRINADEDQKSTLVLGVSQNITKLKKTERWLEEALAKFTLTAGLSSDLFYEIDLATEKMTVEELTPLAEKLGGAGVDIASKWRALLHPDDEERILASRKNLIAGDEPFEVRYRILLPDGTIHWVSDHARIFRDSAGTPLTMLGAVRIITDEVKAEKKLLESEERFRSIWEKSFEGMRLIDDTGKMIMVNRAFAKMMRMPEEELTGRNFTMIYYPKDREGMQTALEKRFASNAIDPFFERKLKLWNGEEIWAEVSNSFLVATPESKLLLSIFRNVTGRKRNEQALRRSEESYRMLYEDAVEGILLMNNKGDVVDANPSLLAMLGFSMDEIRGIHINSLLLSEEGSGKELNLDALLEGKTVRRNYRFRNKYGSEIILSLSAKLIGEYIIQAILRDITAETKARLELEKSERLLREANASKDKFFSIIAHDLKNPFTGLLGFTQYLSELPEGFSEQRVRDIGKKIHAESKNVYALIDNLLNWSRLQTGRLTVSPKPFMIEEAIEEAVRLYKQQLLNKEIAATKNYAPGLMVMADRFFVDTVIRNLLSNAIKFTGRGGTITLAAAASGDEVAIEVRDTGVGLSSDEINRVFRIDEVFSKTGTENEKGTGLGLILCKEFVELMGGELEISSVKGTGTEVRFTIPVAKQ